MQEERRFQGTVVQVVVVLPLSVVKEQVLLSVVMVGLERHHQSLGLLSLVQVAAVVVVLGLAVLVRLVAVMVELIARLVLLQQQILVLVVVLLVTQTALAVLVVRV
jgi:hypothetical protein